MNKEQRAYVCEIKTRQDEKHGNVIEGMPIVFDKRTNIGSMWDEIIEANALKDADLKDVRFLVNHDTTQLPLARSRNNNENSTMQMTVNENGMSVRVDLDTENNTRAKELYSAVSRGDVSGMSFMFTVKEDRWENVDEDMPTRYITSIDKVFEVSACTFPAYEQTKINARAMDIGQAELDNEKKALDNAKRIASMRKEVIERGIQLCKKD